MDDIDRFSFNTAISQFMICVNELRRSEEHSKEILSPLVLLIAPFAPFLSEELWESLGNADSVHKASFPAYDENYLVNNAFTYAISINGKRRSEITLPADTTNKELEEKALSLPEIIKWIEGKPIRKVIIVPEKMINLVV